MSTRYIWSKYTVGYDYTTNYDQAYDTISSGDTIAELGSSAREGLYVGDSCQWTGRSFTLQGNVELWDFYNTGVQETFSGTQLWCAENISGNSWAAGAQVTSGTTVRWYYYHSSDSLECTKTTRRYYVTTTSSTYEVPEDFIEYISSNHSSEWPSYSADYDENSDYVFFVSKDNQEVDPSLTLPTTAEGGDTISLTLTRTQDAIDNRYGTLYYTVEYSLDGSGWTTLANETSNQFSFNISIPKGIETVQARAIVSDNLGYTSDDYVYSNTTSVNNNDPPTAPGRVTASNVYADQVATVSITAATDPNGEVVNYEWQRSVDGGAYSTIQTTDADTLSIKDNIGADWGTVAYRVRAKDDYGEWGPYATSETYTINENLLTIAAPSYSLGMQTSPFYYTFSVGITGNPVTTNGITAIVYLDNRQIHEETDLEKDESVSVPIDPRLLSATTHSILVVASKEGYTTAEQSSDFYIEGISAPAGGIIEQLQNSAGQAVLPYTLGQCVIGRDGKDINTLLEETEAASLKIESGSYSGSGVYGQYNPNTISTSFLPKMFTVTDATGSSSLVWTGSPSVNNIVINATSSGISWYGTSATNQFNSSGQTYYYTVIG